nr:hypothetical protein [Tanacetum cinerariifolium]
MQRLFKLKSILEDLRWHTTRRITDGVLRHLADSQAQRTIEEKFLKIAKDPRNLQLGISADGVDVNSGTRHHSVWLVLSVIYNLPSWLCMKRKFIMLSVLISGYPGNDIDTISTIQPSIQKAKEGVQWTTRISACSKSIDRGTNIQRGLGIKPELFARQEKDKTTLPLACYTLTNAEKDIFCETLSNIKVPQGYCLNFSSLASQKDRKLIGLESHDYHLLMQEFLPIAIRSIMHPPTRYAIIRPEGCIAEETIVKETIEFFSEYHKTMKTIGIPPDKHVTNENEDENPFSAGHKRVLKPKNPGKRIALLENKHSKSFANWLRKEVERELVISKYCVSETVRWISYGPSATIVKYEEYNRNGYTFRTKRNDGIVYQNSGVSVEAVDLHISKEVATTRKAFYYGVLQEIW